MRTITVHSFGLYNHSPTRFYINKIKIKHQHIFKSLTLLRTYLRTSIAYLYNNNKEQVVITPMQLTNYEWKTKINEILLWTLKYLFTGQHNLIQFKTTNLINANIYCALRSFINSFANTLCNNNDRTLL